jgi:Protein O-mannosyl-transferase TMEM260-like/Tetratricopeptide repeat
MNWKKTSNIVAAIILIFTTIVYTLTVAPTVSFWDCGEFIATSFRMSVPHPPGAPLFLMVGRIFSLIPFGSDIAFRINMISVFSSSITIMLLYLVIVHLVREWKGKLETQEDWLVAIFSGTIGSLSFAFTHSFWFNSAEAEVYAASMLFTALLIWLSLVWAERSQERGNEKYLLMISYLIGLAIAVHLLNVLALPFVAMVYYYKRYKFEMKSFMIMTLATVAVILFVYPGIVKILPKIAEFDLFIFGVLIIAVVAIAYWAVLQKKHLLSFVMLSITFIVIGYTSYGIIPIRSALNPNIDENNPETVDKFLKYINREQYGEHSIMDRTKVWKSNPETASDYSSVIDFFWSYQVNHMYNRYFLWQYVGRDDNDNTDFYQFFGLPLIIGLLGMWFHFRKDPQHALAVMALFFMTGLAIILYLNQPDPQPRERDYSYVGSFFAFAVWIGMGYAAIIDMIKESLLKKKDNVKQITMATFATVFAVLLIISPIQMLAKNFHSHNRSGNYVAWDYSYNILMSCAENSILFTNGDNDTFPLWYLQEVENIRTDVRIVNLSLLNTDWYIQQLRDMEPKVPIRMTDEQLQQVQPVQWETRDVSLKIPDKFKNDWEEYKKIIGSPETEMPRVMRFKVDPTIRMRNFNLIRTQDYMILNIMAANQWKKPVYFATTVPQSNLLGGLAEYMRMEGLVMRVVPFKNWRLDPEIMHDNLLKKYQYRFQYPNAYYNPSTKGLLQNYRTPFIALGEYYASNNEPEKIKEIFDYEAKNVPDAVIPWPRSGSAVVLTQRMKALKSLYDPSLIDSMITTESPRALISIGRSLMSMQRFNDAARLLEKANEGNPSSTEGVGLLVQAYQYSGQTDKAIAVLEKWVELNPGDTRAQRMLTAFKMRKE